MQHEFIANIHPKLRVERVIAAGSFGVVFRARQLAVARDVAVKVLHSGLGPDTEPGRLFRDEIRAIGKIDHRNVVRIFDADETGDGRLYFVMELLDGITLQELAERELT
jgi:eukaryotic-like serine/threonine-protein kinase